jgi:hypothetical protein
MSSSGLSLLLESRYTKKKKKNKHIAWSEKKIAAPASVSSKDKGKLCSHAMLNIGEE